MAPDRKQREFEDADASAGTGGDAGTTGTGGSGGNAGEGGTTGAGGTDVGGSSGTGGGSSGTGGTGGTTGCGNCGVLEQCFNSQFCVAKFVQIDGSYSIDATEVTRNQYAAWIATNPTTAGQDAWCVYCSSHIPNASCMSGPYVCQGSSCGDYPQVCIDWCDAFAYCKAVGKRLCGKIGGGASGYGDYANASLNQWFKACSSNGQNVYPYGDTYAGQTCDGNDNAAGGPVPVGSLPGCQSSISGYAGVYDLSGNVWEWEDSCNGYNGAQDMCVQRGGAFNTASTILPCANGAGSYRGDFSDAFGFRCCSL